MYGSKSLSDPSSEADSSEDEESMAALSLQTAYEQSIAQEQLNQSNTSPLAQNNCQLEASVNQISSEKPQPAKKRPPSPETLSKMIGISIKKAPTQKISKKKLNNDQYGLEKKMRRAEELERKYKKMVNDGNSFNHSTAQNPYDLDRMESEDYYAEVSPLVCSPHPESQEEPDKPVTSNSTASDSKPSRRSYKHIGAQWGSMVAPISGEITGESPARSWPEFTSHSSITPSYDQLSEKTSREKYRDKKRGHSKRFKNSYNMTSNSNHSNHQITKSTSSQTISSCLGNKEVSTQTSKAMFLLSSNQGNEQLNKPGYYKKMADDLKAVYTTLSDTMSRIIVQIKICLLETQEAISMVTEKADVNIVSKKLNEVVQSCKKNLDFINKSLDNFPNPVFKKALSVVNLKLMSFLYHNLFLCRRSEVSGAKNILDDFLVKSSSEKKMMTGRVTSATQFYIIYMEYLAKSISCTERAATFIKSKNSEDFFENVNFKDLKANDSIWTHYSLITSALSSLNLLYEQMMNQTPK